MGSIAMPRHPAFTIGHVRAVIRRVQVLSVPALWECQFEQDLPAHRTRGDGLAAPTPTVRQLVRPALEGVMQFVEVRVAFPCDLPVKCNRIARDHAQSIRYRRQWTSGWRHAVVLVISECGIRDDSLIESGVDDGWYPVGASVRGSPAA